MRLFYDDTPRSWTCRPISICRRSQGLPGATPAPRHVPLARRRVDPRAIERTAAPHIRSERDDICAPGQTVAAHICAACCPPRRRRTTCNRSRALRHLQWRAAQRDLSRLRDFISTSARRRVTAPIQLSPAAGPRVGRRRSRLPRAERAGPDGRIGDVGFAAMMRRHPDIDGGGSRASFPPFLAALEASSGGRRRFVSSRPRPAASSPFGSARHLTAKGSSAALRDTGARSSQRRRVGSPADPSSAPNTPPPRCAGAGRCLRERYLARAARVSSSLAQSRPPSASISIRPRTIPKLIRD